RSETPGRGREGFAPCWELVLVLPDRLPLCRVWPVIAGLSGRTSSENRELLRRRARLDLDFIDESERLRPLSVRDGHDLNDPLAREAPADLQEFRRDAHPRRHVAYVDAVLLAAPPQIDEQLAEPLS